MFWVEWDRMEGHNVLSTTGTRSHCTLSRSRSFLAYVDVSPSIRRVKSRQAVSVRMPDQGRRKSVPPAKIERRGRDARSMRTQTGPVGCRIAIVDLSCTADSLACKFEGKIDLGAHDLEPEARFGTARG